MSSFRAFRVVICADGRCILPSETVVASRANICSPAPGSLSFGTQTRSGSFTFARRGRSPHPQTRKTARAMRVPQHYCLIDHPLRRRIWTGGGGEIGIYGPEGETVISAAKLLRPSLLLCPLCPQRPGTAAPTAGSTTGRIFSGRGPIRPLPGGPSGPPGPPFFLGNLP